MLVFPEGFSVWALALWNSQIRLPLSPQSVGIKGVYTQLCFLMFIIGSLGMWRSEDNFVKSVFFYLYVGSRN